MTRIVVRAPETAEEIILCFPFFHAVKNSCPDAVIDVIVDEGLIDLFEPLNFNLALNLFLFPKKQNTMTGVHHFSYNLNDVFNVDTYFDFQNTVKSAFMGKCFNAKDRVGVKTGFNKFFLTNKVDTEIEKKYDRYFLKYLESYKEVNLQSFKVGDPLQEVEEDVADEEEQHQEEFLLVIFTEHSREELWKEIFDCFVDQKFIILSKEDKHREFVKSLDDKNRYEMFHTPEMGKVAPVIKTARGMLSDEYWVGTIASYLGVPSYVFIDKIKHPPFLEHFNQTPVQIKLAGNNPVRISTDKETKIIEHMNQVVDYIHQALRL